jgi:hypothetical protein
MKTKSDTETVCLIPDREGSETMQIETSLVSGKLRTLPGKKLPYNTSPVGIER